MSYVRYYVMQAKPGGAEQLCGALQALRTAVEGLPGSLGVELLVDSDKPESFHFIERWDGPDNHGRAGKLLPAQIMSAIGAALAAAPAGVSLTPVPGD